MIAPALLAKAWSSIMDVALIIKEILGFLSKTCSQELSRDYTYIIKREHKSIQHD